MKPRQPGYLTQCDQQSLWFSCPNTIRLAKPGHWRCEECTKKVGPLKVRPA